MKKLITILILCLSFNTYAQQLAFPTAKGAGAYTTGGEGGQVIHVTTLDWNAAGGLKEAIQTPGPRVIVFDVSGEIDATSQWDYTPIISGSSYDDITIAGQTAPNGGITILTSEFMFQNVSNVIIRYIRFRSNPSSIQDAFWFAGGSNIIVDHCTFSHGGDESGSLASSSGTMGDITMQNCFFQDSKTGTILGVDHEDGDFTFVNNVYNSISHRFPNPKGNGQYDIINNVVYNWKYRLVRISYGGTYNILNNYYKPATNGLRLSGWFGSTEITSNFLQKLQTNASYSPLIYTAGNIITGQRETPLTDDRDMWTVFDGSHLAVNSQVPNEYFTTTQFPLVGNTYTIETASDTYNTLLDNVGAYKTLNADGSLNVYRDSKDADDIDMIKNDSYNGTFYSEKSIIPYAVIPENTRSAGFYVSNPHIPESYLVAKGITGNSNTHNTLAPSGYTWLREYHNEIDGDITPIAVESVSITPESKSLIVEENTQLSFEILPADASNKTGVWSSSNNAVATIDQNGNVTALSEGSTTVVFTSNDGSFTDTSVIAVTAPEVGELAKKYKIILISN